MKSLVCILLAVGTAAVLVGAANAQPREVGPRAVLYDQPNFQGDSVSIVNGSPDLNQWDFGGRAMSARFEGDWTVCDAANLDGRCVSLKGDVADLTRIGIGRILSLGGGLKEDPEDGPVVKIADARADEAPPPPGPEAQAAAAPAAAHTRAASPPPIVVPPPAAYVTTAAADPSTTAQAAQGDAGRAAVFFAKPTRGGAEIAVDVKGPANQFCHDQGLGPAVYFDTDGHSLRDVLCHRP
jgi:hypothetical protein